MTDRAVARKHTSWWCDAATCKSSATTSLRCANDYKSLSGQLVPVRSLALPEKMMTVAKCL